MYVIFNLWITNRWKSNMFLRASIERILNETGTRRKENAELKKACEEALGNIEFNFDIFKSILERLNLELQSLGQKESTDVESSAILPNSSTVFLADHYFLPFELVNLFI